MANKTTPTSGDVSAFLDAIEDEQKREDCFRIKQMMERTSGHPATLWGPSIVGFGSYHYRYDSGREGDFMRIGFAPRAANLSLYIMPGFADYEPLLKQLGKHKLGKACLYIKRLGDVDEGVLGDIIERAWKDMAQRYPMA